MDVSKIPKPAEPKEIGSYDGGTFRKEGIFSVVTFNIVGA